jgi:hypothetical protein
MDWSDEKQFLLLKYIVNVVSVGPNNSLYKNRNKRHDGLMEIAVSFGIEKCDVEKN